MWPDFCTLFASVRPSAAAGSSMFGKVRCPSRLEPISKHLFCLRGTGGRSLNGLNARAAGQGTAELRLTEECIASFLEELARKGRTPGTLDTYQRNICSLYDALPEDKTLLPGTLDRWQQDMLAEGYSPRTVNTRLSVANHLVAFLGRRELQTRGTLQIGEGGTPELTRREYLRLLSTARILGKERIYLLVKLFGSTELAVGDLEQLTVEALRGEEACPVRLPDFLRRELLDYASPVPDQERPPPGPHRRHRQHEAAVPGRPGGGGESKSQVPQAPVADDPRRFPGPAGLDGGTGLRRPAGG